MAISYLYNSGTGAGNWSEGPSTAGIDYFDYTVESISLHLEGSGDFYEWATIKSNAVDLTDWSEVKGGYVFSASEVLEEDDESVAFFGISTSGTAEYPSGYETYFSSHPITDASTVETVNVSSYSGEYYLYFGLKTAGFPTFIELDLEWVRLSGVDVVGNSGSVGYYNTPLLNMFCDSILFLADTSGTVVRTLGNIEPYSAGYNETDTYGQLNTTLGDISLETISRLTNLGSGNNSFENLGKMSFATNNNAKIGSLSTLYPLEGISSVSSGVATITYAGYLNKTLGALIPTVTGTDEPPTEESSYSFLFTKASRKFTGKSCQILDLETVNNKIDESCFVMVKAYPVSINTDITQYNFTSCNCTVDIPIYLNRIHSEDVNLNLVTRQPSSSTTVSGESVRPSLSGQDFTYTSGNITIPSGSLYANFSVPLLEWTGDNLKNYFTVESIYNSPRNLCEYSHTINVVILATGV